MSRTRSFMGPYVGVFTFHSLFLFLSHMGLSLRTKKEREKTNISLNLGTERSFEGGKLGSSLIPSSTSPSSFSFAFSKPNARSTTRNNHFPLIPPWPKFVLFRVFSVFSFGERRRHRPGRFLYWRLPFASLGPQRSRRKKIILPRNQYLQVRSCSRFISS